MSCHVKKSHLCYNNARLKTVINTTNSQWILIMCYWTFKNHNWLSSIATTRGHDRWSRITKVEWVAVTDTYHILSSLSYLAIVNCSTTAQKYLDLANEWENNTTKGLYLRWNNYWDKWALFWHISLWKRHGHTIVVYLPFSDPVTNSNLVAIVNSPNWPNKQLPFRVA